MKNKLTLARDPKYLSFIRQQKCCVTGTELSVEAHHCTLSAQRGISQKPSDYWCVPINSMQHQNLHAMGEKTFWSRLSINPHLVAAGYLFHYLITVCGSREEAIELLTVLNEFAANRGNDEH